MSNNLFIKLLGIKNPRIFLISVVGVSLPIGVLASMIAQESKIAIWIICGIVFVLISYISLYIYLEHRKFKTIRNSVIGKIYKNQDDAIQDIQNSIQECEENEEIRILIIRGKYIFDVEHPRGTFARTIEALPKEVDVKVLLPVLTEDFFNKNKRIINVSYRNFHELQSDINATIARVKTLNNNSKANVEYRLYTIETAAFWKLFLFKKCAFVNSYVLGKNIHEVPVYKISNNSFTLYSAFSKMFDDIWYKHSKTSSKEYGETMVT
ncbi:MAG: hypothetical protein JSV88_22985 [Candidatus Aminicenantes bacterium]|nr:MAG: hypothetical protein JSV88_22985 [Candidatus Aminicenantes bacterium]